MFWEDLVEHAIAPLNYAGNRTQRAMRLFLRDVYATRLRTDEIKSYKLGIVNTSDQQY